MDQADVVAKGRVRKRWPVAEKRRIVGLTLQPGASVALVARAQGVNANQVFAWRRAFERGELAEPSVVSAGLIPVTVSGGQDSAQAPSVCQGVPGWIHLELTGRALVSVESGADPSLLRVILESLRK